MSADPQLFSDDFLRLTGHSPMRWQHRLFDQFVDGKIPAALDLPTGLGKTSVMAIWVLARTLATEFALKSIPRRLVYVVDRRAVVDQATAEAEKLRTALEAGARHLKERLRLGGTLPISTLRGAYADNREWLDDPAAPAIIVGTVDMIGSVNAISMCLRRSLAKRFPVANASARCPLDSNGSRCTPIVCTGARMPAWRSA